MKNKIKTLAELFLMEIETLKDNDGETIEFAEYQSVHLTEIGCEVKSLWVVVEEKGKEISRYNIRYIKEIIWCNNQDHISPTINKKPTVEELQAILDGGPQLIEVMPNGELRTIDPDNILNKDILKSNVAHTAGSCNCEDCQATAGVGIFCH